MLFINYAAAPHPNPRDRGRYFLRSPFRPSFAGVAPRTALQQDHVPPTTGVIFVVLGSSSGLDGSESGGCEGKNWGRAKFRQDCISRVAESERESRREPFSTLTTLLPGRSLLFDVNIHLL